MAITCCCCVNFVTFYLSLGLLIFRFKFDDERVTKEDIKRALEEQYGGEEEVLVFRSLVVSF